ncbi:hypothetical protein, partial [Sphaerospermopsis reniformis]|uniref:hypothetical protein n=1 Tax=Sphaerospermopsis reniformis TaxID=531300 RepID=UPI0010F7EC31
QWLRDAAKYNLELTELNVGGGLGIKYTESDDPPSIEEWSKAISRKCVWLRKWNKNSVKTKF